MSWGTTFTMYCTKCDALTYISMPHETNNGEIQPWTATCEHARMLYVGKLKAIAEAIRTAEWDIRNG